MVRSLAALTLLCLLFAAPATGQTGGVNTGLPGSTCAAGTGGFTYKAPPADIAVNAVPGAPAAHEVGQPTAAGTPKGVMLVLHGGGWYAVGAQMLTHVRPAADRWRSRGWVTVNSTYAACGASVDSVVALYDAVRANWPGLPICAWGTSAGAHLALMLATRRPDLACVAGQGAPTDLSALTGDTYWRAVAAFGPDGLDAASPALQSAQIQARVLISHATADPLVPLKQAIRLDDAIPFGRYSDIVVLDPGPESFTHANIATASRDSLHRRELNLIAPIAGSAPAECDICGAGLGWSRTQTAAAAVTMNNRVMRGATQLGTFKPVLSVAATGGTWSLPATTLRLPAGRHRLQTCFGAAGAAVTPFDNCVEREVTLTAAGPAATLAKTLGFARLDQPYSYYAALFVKTYSNGTWADGGGSWHGNHASRITVPPVGAAL